MNQELEYNIYRIISGKLIFTVNNQEYILRSATPNLKYKANMLYDSILGDEKYNDWIRADRLEQYMSHLEIWNSEMSAFIKKADKEIENLKVSLYTNRLNQKMTQRTRFQLESIRKRVNDLQNTRQTYYAQTLEGYAESIKYEYIVINSIYKGKKKVFAKFGSLQNSYDYFSTIVNEINQHTISTQLYRSIARSDYWRSFWTIDKTNVFEGPVTLWTEEQRTLAGYSAMYDSIYEHPEHPIESVINDDDMLDGWMIMQRREREKTKQQDSIVKSNSKLGKAQEVFVFTDNAEAAREVMDMNSAEANLAIAQRSHSIDKQGSVAQGSLPDIQKELLHK